VDVQVARRDSRGPRRSRGRRGRPGPRWGSARVTGHQGGSSPSAGRHAPGCRRRSRTAPARHRPGPGQQEPATAEARQARLGDRGGEPGRDRGVEGVAAGLQHLDGRVDGGLMPLPYAAPAAHGDPSHRLARGLRRRPRLQQLRRRFDARRHPAVVDACDRRGRHLFDTADVYGGDGTSEELLGRGARVPSRRGRDRHQVRHGARRRASRRPPGYVPVRLRGQPAPARDGPPRPLPAAHAPTRTCRSRRRSARSTSWSVPARSARSATRTSAPNRRTRRRRRRSGRRHRPVRVRAGPLEPARARRRGRHPARGRRHGCGAALLPARLRAADRQVHRRARSRTRPGG
jgi:hypothetical protein